jgi:hypothetical protein
MSDVAFCYQYRIVGPVTNDRRIVSAVAVLEAYSRCEDRARVQEESYLSAFYFNEGFREHLKTAQTTRGFQGATWSPWIWFDIDREPSEGGIDKALADVRRLGETLVGKFAVPEEQLVSFFSGSKGFHLGCPTSLWAPAGGPAFHRLARAFAEIVAGEAQIRIDTGIYDAVRAFRAPNSRHPKTGLHKRFIPSGQLGVLTSEDILDLARSPAPFELPVDFEVGSFDRLVAAWQEAEAHVASQDAAAAQRRAAGPDAAVHVNQLTLDVIRGCNVAVGDRHRSIYSAARNLADCGASRELTVGLITEGARDLGLTPSEVARQIDCGWKDAQPPLSTDVSCS